MKTKLRGTDKSLQPIYPPIPTCSYSETKRAFLDYIEERESTNDSIREEKNKIDIREITKKIPGRPQSEQSEPYDPSEMPRRSVRIIPTEDYWDYVGSEDDKEYGAALDAYHSYIDNFDWGEPSEEIVIGKKDMTPPEVYRNIENLKFKKNLLEERVLDKLEGFVEKKKILSYYVPRGRAKCSQHNVILEAAMKLLRPEAMKDIVGFDLKRESRLEAISFMESFEKYSHKHSEEPARWFEPISKFDLYSILNYYLRGGHEDKLPIGNLIFNGYQKNDEVKQELFEEFSREFVKTQNPELKKDMIKQFGDIVNKSKEWKDYFNLEKENLELEKNPANQPNFVSHLYSLYFDFNNTRNNCNDKSVRSTAKAVWNRIMNYEPVNIEEDYSNEPGPFYNQDKEKLGPDLLEWKLKRVKQLKKDLKAVKTIRDSGEYIPGKQHLDWCEADTIVRNPSTRVIPDEKTRENAQEELEEMVHTKVDYSVGLKAAKVLGWNEREIERFLNTAVHALDVKMYWQREGYPDYIKKRETKEEIERDAKTLYRMKGLSKKHADSLAVTLGFSNLRKKLRFLEVDLLS
ncbi:hypothetical protein GF378_02300 [Candidatus Pacearchaeota archaeon]|nr:hypothetical protein [Candidatus Pacearchaeota archaeon]